MSEQNPWQEVKKHLPISEYLSKHGIQFKTRGKTLHCRCPFPCHDDTAPSFVVYDDQRYYCYGCAANPAAKSFYQGDIFDLMSALEQRSRQEIFVELCQQFSVQATGEVFERIKARLEESELRKSEANSFSINLANSIPWLTYLQKVRGLTDNTIAFFNLGLNLSIQKIVIPLRDDYGRLMGFTEHNPKADPKYKNPETSDIYHKDAFLYNIDALRAFLENDNVVYIVEGYFDVMSMWQAGYKQVVGLCGAKLTTKQVALLKKYINADTRIVFVPDTDRTGWNTLETNFIMLRKSLANPCSVSLLGGVTIEQTEIPIKDANDWFTKGKQVKLPPAHNYFDVITQYHISMCPEDPQIQLQHIKNATQLSNDIERAMVVKYLTKTTEFSEEALSKYLNSSSNSMSADSDIFKDTEFRISEYVSYVNDLSRTRLSIGFPEIDAKIRGLNPGEVLGLMGRANTCKTLVATDLFVKQARLGKDVPTVFFSLEMASTQLQERMIAQFMGLEGDNNISPSKVVEEAVLNKSPQIMAVLESLKTLHQKFIVIDKPGLSVEDMNALLDVIETRIFGCNVELVIVDHLHIVKSPGRVPYERTSAAVKDFRAMIKRRKTCAGILLIQTSRKGGSGGEPITMDDARDSGEIEETLDFMLGVWRPELKAQAELEKLRSDPIQPEQKAKKDHTGKYLKNDDGDRAVETTNEAYTRERRERSRKIQLASKSIEAMKGIVMAMILKSRREGRNASFKYKLKGLSLEFICEAGTSLIDNEHSVIEESEVVISNDTPVDDFPLPGKAQLGIPRV